MSKSKLAQILEQAFVNNDLARAQRALHPSQRTRRTLTQLLHHESTVALRMALRLDVDESVMWSLLLDAIEAVRVEHVRVLLAAFLSTSDVMEELVGWIPRWLELAGEKELCGEEVIDVIVEQAMESDAEREEWLAGLLRDRPKRVCRWAKPMLRRNPDIFWKRDKTHVSPMCLAMQSGNERLLHYLLVEEKVRFHPASIKRVFVRRDVACLRLVCELVLEAKTSVPLPTESASLWELNFGMSLDVPCETSMDAFAVAASAPAGFWLSCIDECFDSESQACAARFLKRLMSEERLREMAGPLLCFTLTAGLKEEAVQLAKDAAVHCVEQPCELRCVGSYNGDTHVDALRVACAVGNSEVAKVLLDAGMPPTGITTSSTALSPFGLALSRGHRECAMLMLEVCSERGEVADIGAQASRNRRCLLRDVITPWVRRRDVAMCKMLWSGWLQHALRGERVNHHLAYVLVGAVMGSDAKAEPLTDWLCGEGARLVEELSAPSVPGNLVECMELADLQRGVRVWPFLLRFSTSVMGDDAMATESLMHGLVSCDRCELVEWVVKSPTVLHSARVESFALLGVTCSRSAIMLRLLLRAAATMGEPLRLSEFVHDRNMSIYERACWADCPELLDVFLSEAPQSAQDVPLLMRVSGEGWKECISSCFAFGVLQPSDTKVIALLLRRRGVSLSIVELLVAGGVSPWVLAPLVQQSEAHAWVEDAQEHARLFQLLTGLNVGGSESALGRMKAHRLFDANVSRVVVEFLRRDAAKPWLCMQHVQARAAPAGSLAAFVPDDVLRSAVRPSGEGAFSFEVDVQQVLAARGARPAGGGGGEQVVAEPEQQPVLAFDGAAFAPDFGSFGGDAQGLANPFEVDSSVPSGGSAAPAASFGFSSSSVDPSAPSFGSSAGDDGDDGDDSSAPFSFSFASIGGSDDSANPFTVDGSNPFAQDNPFS